MASKIEIINWTQVQMHFKNLDLTVGKRVPEVRKIMRKPFARMRSKAKSNLVAMMSTSPVSKGNLSRGLSVGSRFSKKQGYFTVAFGGRGKAINAGKPMRKGKVKTPNKRRPPINHFHLVNSGTKKRYHRNWKSVGAVGKAKTGSEHPLMNPNFKIGFADKAIVSELPRIQSEIPSELAAMYNRIKTAGT